MLCGALPTRAACRTGRRVSGQLDVHCTMSGRVVLLPNGEDMGTSDWGFDDAFEMGVPAPRETGRPRLVRGVSVVSVEP